jgi:hypothetical protein
VPYFNWVVTASIAGAFILFLACVVAIFVGNSPLRVVDHRNELFWVKGFSEAYMAELTFDT